MVIIKDDDISDMDIAYDYVDGADDVRSDSDFIPID